jgi:23S rRNA (uracil1939-C5)-methyltransferase
MRQPPCKYFGDCAGCSLQNLEHSEQLSRKKAELSRLLGTENISLHSGPEIGYRNRMEFLFLPEGIGLRRKDSPGKLLKIENCPICSPPLNKLLSDLNQNFSSNSSAFRYAVIRATSLSDSISFVLNESSPLLNVAVQKIKDYSKTSPAENILITYTNPDEDEQSSTDFFVVRGEPHLSESLLGRRFAFSAQGFFQNNTAVAEKLQTYVQSLLKGYDTKNSTLLDLYAGVGTFGIINSSLFREVLIVESFGGCTDSAEQNLKLNSIKNALVFRLEAHSIGRLKISGDSYVITDPPRSGMAEKAIEQIKRLKPRAIIYISCNPSQLAKDLKKFRSYELVSTALFDMFPQTRHIEAVAELRLKQG